MLSYGFNLFGAFFHAQTFVNTYSEPVEGLENVFAIGDVTAHGGVPA